MRFCFATGGRVLGACSVSWVRDLGERGKVP